jgi:serine/threonine protein kinase
MVDFTSSHDLFIIDKSSTHSNSGKPKNLLGKGQSGKVWRGMFLNQSVAIKVLKSKNLLHFELLEELKREAKFLIQSTCPDIVLLIGMCTTENNLMLATELLDGDLESWHAAHDFATVSLAKKISLVVDATRGVNYMHQFGLIHCDIKPANIFINSKSWRAKIGDLGLSMYDSERYTPVGTPLFSSPEILLEKRPPNRDEFAKVDVFSLASVVAWIVNNGRRLLSKTSIPDMQSLVRFICTKRRRPDLDHPIPDSLRVLLDAAWEHSPRKRVSSDRFLQLLVKCYYDCHFSDRSFAEWWRNKFTDEASRDQLTDTAWDSFAKELATSATSGKRPFTSKFESALRRDVCGSDSTVSIEKFAAVCDQFGPFSRLVRNLRHFYSQPYFPDVQDLVLNSTPPGVYFLRKSSRPGSWTFISTSPADGTIERLRVSYNPGSKTWRAGSEMESFSSLRSLVKKYKSVFDWKSPLTDEMLANSDAYF